MTDRGRKGVLRIENRHNPQPVMSTVDVVQLKDSSWKLQPQNGVSGYYMHIGPSYTHVDYYGAGEDSKVKHGAYVVSNYRMSGSVSPFFVPCGPSVAIGFAGSIVGAQGIGSMNVCLTESGIVVSASDRVHGRLFVGSIDYNTRNVYFASGTYS